MSSAVTTTTTTTTYETRSYAFPNAFGTLPEKLFPFRWVFVVVGIIICIIGFCLFVASPSLLVAANGFIDPGVVVMGFFGIFLFFIGGLLILCGCFTHRYLYTSARETPLVTTHHVNGPVETVVYEEKVVPPPKKPPVGGFSYTAPRQ